VECTGLGIRGPHAVGLIGVIRRRLRQALDPGSICATRVRIREAEVVQHCHRNTPNGQRGFRAGTQRNAHTLYLR
jgi:hypothetical protein